MDLDYIKFNENNYDDEGDILNVMEEMERRKGDLKVMEKEWHAVWMLKRAQKRRAQITSNIML